MSRFSKLGVAVAAVLLTWAPTGLAGQETDNNPDNTPYGTTSAEFLLLGAGARGTALGGAFAAIATDVSSLYYNPGAAALLPRPGASFSTYDYVADTRYSWGGIAFPFSGGSRTFGLQLGTFGFDNQPVYTVAQPEGTGAVYSVSQTFAGATFAQNFSDRFSAGVTAKFVFDQLGEVSGNAFAVDFGTSFHTTLKDHPIRLAFTVSNLGTDLKYSGDALRVDVERDPADPTAGSPPPELPQPADLKTKGFALPTIFRVALAYDLIAGESNRLTLISDFNQANNSRAAFAGGGEWAMNRLGGSNFGVALRGSYSYQPANNIEFTDPTQTTALGDEENLHGLALGGGLMYGSGNFSLGLDYAYKYLGVLGPTNFFTLSVGW
ncbi:MAG TPA: PorV/PorQ family protein [Gemmatimonadales bacterium]|nr:PorV/PorQ family protein [Gemmatimonadales bacterium]